MRLRKLAPKTQAAYIRAVRKFTKFLGHTPGKATSPITPTQNYVKYRDDIGTPLRPGILQT